MFNSNVYLHSVTSLVWVCSSLVALTLGLKHLPDVVKWLLSALTAWKPSTRKTWKWFSWHMDVCGCVSWDSFVCHTLYQLKEHCIVICRISYPTGITEPVNRIGISRLLCGENLTCKDGAYCIITDILLEKKSVFKSEFKNLNCSVFTWLSRLTWHDVTKNWELFQFGLSFRYCQKDHEILWCNFEVHITNLQWLVSTIMTVMLWWCRPMTVYSFIGAGNLPMCIFSFASYLEVHWTHQHDFGVLQL